MTSTPPAASADLLATIVAATRRIVEVREDQEPLSALAKRAERRAMRRGRFSAALSQTTRVNVIAECKRRSPSRDVLRREYDAPAIARGYDSAGAAAISVLTEPTFFDGSLADLVAVRAAVNVPLLRKDFIVSQYQILEARAAGADAILLIVGALAADDVKTLISFADAHDLDALVEVHDRAELQVAIESGARIVGVNNRNLRTLEVGVRTSEELIALLPPDVIAVSESGLRSADDLQRLRALGYHAFLIGERFMTEADPGLALRTLLEAAAADPRSLSSAASTARRGA
jgi:indole-3-glycerol phosphate synthase